MAPQSSPLHPKRQRWVFLCLSHLGPHHPCGHPAGARGLFSQSPMKCSSSAHLLPVPCLGSGPQSRAGLSAQRDLSRKISPSFTWEALTGWGGSLLCLLLPVFSLKGKAAPFQHGAPWSVLLLARRGVGQVSSGGPHAWALGTLDCSPRHLLGRWLQGLSPVPERWG